MNKLTIQEFGATIKQKYPQYSGLPDYEIGQKTLTKYPQYQEKVTHTFDVPEITQTPQQKMASATQQASQAQVESKKANSFGGKLANFGKAFVENIAPSEVGLGRTIGKLAGNNTETYSKIIQDTSNQQANLLKAIRNKEASGGDATSLKRIYNDNVNQLREINKNLAEESDLPSNAKVAGQLGSTALDLLTAGTYSKAKTGLMTSGKLAPSASSLTEKIATSAGLPELGAIAKQKAGGLFTKKGVGNVLTGAGIGYANDVSMGLQGLRGEDREGTKSLIPGLGTAIGTTIPVVSEATQTVKNLTSPEFKDDKLIKKRQFALNKLDKYQTIKKATEKGNERGIDIKKLLSETDVLAGTVDNTGTITTKGEDGAIAQYTKQFIDGNESIVSDLLKKENRSISPSLVKARLIQQVKNAGIEGKNLTSALKAIDDEVAGYMLRANEQGNIPVAIIHDAKIDKYNGINFFTEGATKKYDKTVAKALKEIVEETTTSADIKKINGELSKHFAVIDYLNKLDNKKVDGGKLGKYFAQTVGAIVGGQLGPVGAVAGAELGGRVKGGMMARSFGGRTGKIPQQAEVITEALKVKNAPPLELAQSKSNSLGNRQINQATTNNPVMNGISNTIQKAKDYVKEIPNKQGGFATGISYKNEGNLTTKILKDLEGKTTVSKQYILDATNRGELKQVERDITRQVLDTMPDGQINVKEFADKVKSELLPLKRNDELNPSAMGGYKYENVTLPEELRGSVENYSENIYESPIKTSAGNIHFSGDTKNYFGHTRIEDMADEKTRRVIEVQSDLYQKGNLEKELLQPEMSSVDFKIGKDEYTVLPSKKMGNDYELSINKNGGNFTETTLSKMKPEFRDKINAELQAKYGDILSKDKLQQYNDPTAHFRMVREEIKKASQDGKTRLQFPTGETALKIEGLGQGNTWHLGYNQERGGGIRLTTDALKVGEEVVQGSDKWIITDVLGDGKFKAVQKQFLDAPDFMARYKKKLETGVDELTGVEDKILADEAEQFDISGKVDTSNPIYKFYEKDVQKYLNKFGGKKVVDDKGVSWIEIPITKEQGKVPVEAFGKAQLGVIGTGALLSGAGVLGASYIKSRKEKK